LIIPIVTGLKVLINGKTHSQEEHGGEMASDGRRRNAKRISRKISVLAVL
jgi:hypothetical protein